VGILKKGKLIALKNIEELQKEKARVVSIYFEESYNIDDFRLKGVEIQDTEDLHLHLTIQGEVDPLVKILAKYKIRDISFSEAELEDVFLKYYGEK
jgi:ABC-2 type transport system ATP-binding protein